MFRSQFLAFGAAFVLAITTSAQDPMWVANRFSSDIHRVDLCGNVQAPVGIGTNLRRVRVAPDGKLWVIKFIQATFDIRNPDGSLFLTVTSTVGNGFDVAFDKNGNAWFTGGGTAVQEYDPNGVPVTTYALAAAAALGITVDADGNKWIAHRIAGPGSVSRIDAVTGLVTNHPGPAGSVNQPTAVVADFRGVGVSSHIWVVGDSGSTLDEYDNLGNALNAYPIGTSLGSVATDLAGNLWCGSFGNGNVYQVNPLTGTPTATYNLPPTVLGVEFDSFGRLWATIRVSFSGPAPSEVRRIDPATGSVEVVGVIGLGAQSALSTRQHFAMVVDPLGDADGDGETNIAELVVGTSPYDPQSTSFTSLTTLGSTAQGATPVLTLTTQPSNASLLAAATSLISPGLTFTGVSGALFLDPTTLLIDPGTSSILIVPVTGPIAIPIPIPNPGPVGLVLNFQAVTSSLTGSSFSNAPCIKVY